MNKVLKHIIWLLIIGGCTSPDQIELQKSKNVPLFTIMDAGLTNVYFSNRVVEDTYFNFINYPYVYNGGGVSAADFNNDGLVDLYFTANQTSNKLYINKGDFEFEDITESAGVSDAKGWTTGTTVMDINNDGWLDIYVCKSGSLRNPTVRENILYINQGDNTFVNEAEKWNLNDPGYSIQAYPIDYDQDGDLDIYLVNHRPDFENNATILSSFEVVVKSPFTDRLYRNDGNEFSDVTDESKIQNNAWGLSAVIGDFNNDDWSDIYVCNDFLEPDFLYINDREGGFVEQVGQAVDHISMNSMGSDYNDINNDGYMDLMVAEMSPSDHVRSKKNMASMSTENFESMVASNYQHQYMSNTLQLNEGNGKYSEISYLANVAKTDWSWSPLIADFDNDGYKDVFVTNGIIKDLSNSDFRNKLKSKIARREKMSLDQAVSMIPSNPLVNPIFKNNGDLTFEKVNEDWGINQLSFSNGTAIADLDNDGDLDLIVNNANDSAFIYKNNTSSNHFIVKLKGSKENPLGIGARVNLYAQNKPQTNEMYLSRGYQSSMPNVLHFGLDSLSSVDSIEVIWPNRRKEVRRSIGANQIITFEYDKSIVSKSSKVETERLVRKVNAKDVGIDFIHQENDFNDYNKQLLLPYKLSQSGPFMTKGDVNNDGLEDLYIGGAADQSGKLYLQTSTGTFEEKKEGGWVSDSQYEDVGGVFFDVDNDKDLDLYVVSGGNEFKIGSPLYRDRLYINENGKFEKSQTSLPDIRESGKVVIADDFDLDGDVDLFVGSRLVPGQYPKSPTSYFLINEGGVLVDNSIITAPELSKIGMITSAVFTDYDSDGDNDLLTVGEWNGIQLLENNNGIFSRVTVPTLENTRGLWFSLDKQDIDGDGDDDYFLGNLGLNSKYKTSKGKEFHVFASDFDESGTVDVVLSNKYKGDLVPVRGRECSSEQTPFIKDKFPDYNSYAKATMDDIFGEKQLEASTHYQVDILESVMVLNNGKDGFEIVKLPKKAQIGTILDFAFTDISGDGMVEILAVGNMYEMEVETVRMDASKGTVMKWKNNSKLEILRASTTGFFVEGNTKSVMILNRSNGDQRVLLGNNNAEITMFEH